MSHLHPALTEFIERFALLAEEDGHPRIAGRILGLLIVRGEPLSFDEIVESLHVSRGSVSTNTRLLEQRGVIRRVSRLGERRDLFELGRDAHQRMLETSLRRQQRMRDLAAESRKAFPQSEGRARTSLKEMEEFFSVIIETTEKAIERLRKR
ncbi:MAG TPA: MarR family transcriptional regulator [Thermoanaerobaculia bacterium]|jgi:DNA-binding transcriptional regulator GbsR (MarR family)|nr:MarR family transcriptional regulator [Thermoanaerobaculia bacterium]